MTAIDGVEILILTSIVRNVAFTTQIFNQFQWWRQFAKRIEIMHKFA